MKIDKVTYFAREVIDSPLEHLRILRPNSYAGIEVLLGYENGQVKPGCIDQGQLVLFQREFPLDLNAFQQVHDEAKAAKKPLVYDLDDLLLDLPEIHPDRQSAYFVSSLLPILKALVQADYITASTEMLRESLLKFNKNVFVLHNYFDDSIWSLKQPVRRTRSDLLTIGYMGGESHRPDLEMIAPVLLDLAQMYPNKIGFHFYGVQPPQNLLTLPQIQWTPTKTIKYGDFAADFQKLDIDICIAPLVDNLFNRCKSAVKFFEYSALGAAGVFSRLEPYTDVITHGEEGLLASSLDEWRENLIQLIEDDDLRYRLATWAQETIQAKWLMSKNAYRWEETYRLICEKGPTTNELSSVPLSAIDMISEQVIEYRNKAEKEIREKKELQRAYATLDDQYQSTRFELHEIHISKTWRLALIFRNARVKLLPPGSRLLALAQLAYRKVKITWGKLAKNYSGLVKRHRLSASSNTPLISVVIPIYDRTDILIESIESILSQTYQNIELILVCDGSPEATLEIVRRYERTSPKVRAFYFKSNSGNAVRGRNKGIKEAKGEYLAFQDSDDIADPNRLKNSLEAMQLFGADVVYGGWRAILDGTRDIGVKNREEIFSPDCDLEYLKKACVPCQSTVMARVEALRKVGGVNPAMRYHEDHELWLRLADHGYKFKAVNQILTNLRLHKGNLELSLKDADERWHQLALNEYQKTITMKPKIGYVLPGTGISGGIAVVCEHVNRLIKRGYDVSIIAEDQTNDIPWFPGLLSEVIPLKNIASNYDILVATGWATAYTVDQLPAKRKFYFIQSDESRFFNPGDPNIELAARTYTLDLEIITIAKWMQRWLKEKYGRDSIYAPNGINEEIVHQVEPIERKTDKVRVLLEGPISIAFKGMEDAFKAVEGLDCEVWCVSSSGKPKPEWKCDRFFYKVPFDKMKEVYSSCDILLKMSRVEGAPLPPLEMMACGGTCVLGKVTGIEEYSVHNHNCLIVPQGDVAAAHEALKRLIEDSNLRQKLTINARKTAQQHRWDATINILEKAFSPCEGQNS